MRALGGALADLGLVFASFGRYLSSRVDLLARRDCAELAAIADRGDALEPDDLAAAIERELGVPIERRYFSFDVTPRHVTLWTEQHDAWLSPGVPATVTVVRPDAQALLAFDLPLLPLVGSWLGLPDVVVTGAVDDFAGAIRLRLDQQRQAASFAKLSTDARAGGLLDAPGTYRDHCAAGVLTCERLDGIPLDDAVARRAQLPVDAAVMSRRLATAWLRQATTGQVVPYDFELRDVLLAGDRFVLRGGAFEPQTASGRAAFLNYVIATAGDDPDVAATWLLAGTGAETDTAIEDEVRRRLRQAVPFRDGEWSGDDRLAEQLLVQWRVARQAGWQVASHQLNVYRGVYALSLATAALAPDTDALLAATQEERLRVGFGSAQPFFDPRAMPAVLDKLMQDMVNLPRKLDQVLTQAADGRLRVKLHLPSDDKQRRTRNTTVSLVSALVVLTALAFALRNTGFAGSPGFEQLGALAVMIIGVWLLIAAARL